MTSGQYAGYRAKGVRRPPGRATGADEPLPGMRLAWHFLPSRPVGGDCFAVAPWGADTLGCYMLDVSGHGVSAAMRATSLAELLDVDRLPKHIGSQDPGQLLTVLNQQFPLATDGQSFTIWLGCLFLPTGELRFSTAGHAGALILRAGGAVERISAPSFPIGYVPDLCYSTATTALRAGDRLLMFSDGLYDAASPDGERWGLNRLQVAAKQYAHLKLVAHVNAVLAAARGWQQRIRFDDDAALVGLEIT